MRRLIGVIRRSLVAHRPAFAALARPEMELHEELGRPWPGLGDRLERALEGVESLRDSLLGTFDIHMGRAAQQANEVMKVLTILSAILLPSVVLAGIMGMNFQVPILDNADNFWLVLAAMVTNGCRDHGDRPPARLDLTAGRHRGQAAAGGSRHSSVSVSSASANPNSAPPSGRDLAQIRPPIAAMSLAHTKRPMPAPGAIVAVPGER